MPTVAEALQLLERELARSRQAGCKVVKLIHGYGSSGAGGEIRIAAQRRLTEMASRGEIRACIFGEDWAKSDQQSWALINAHSELKQDTDLGRRNLELPSLCCDSKFSDLAYRSVWRHPPLCDGYARGSGASRQSCQLTQDAATDVPLDAP